MQDLGSAESEQNPLVNCLHYLFSAFADDQQTQHSGLGFFANAQNLLITGGTFVSLSHILSKIIYFPEQYFPHHYR